MNREEGEGPKYHTGKPCIEAGCDKPAGTAWTPLWCAEHDRERIARITASLTALAAPKEPMTLPHPVGAHVASALMAADIPCDSGEDVDRFLSELAKRGVHLTGAERPEISDNQAALESLPDAVQGADLNLPGRVIVDQHGHYWRDYGDFLSMPPVSDENTATEVIHVYALVPAGDERLAALIEECYQRGLDGPEAAAFLLAAGVHLTGDAPSPDAPGLTLDVLDVLDALHETAAAIGLDLVRHFDRDHTKAETEDAMRALSGRLSRWAHAVWALGHQTINGRNTPPTRYMRHMAAGAPPPPAEDVIRTVLAAGVHLTGDERWRNRDGKTITVLTGDERLVEAALLERALVEAVIPLEVIAGQDRVKPYAEISRDFIEVINAAVGTVRAALDTVRRHLDFCAGGEFCSLDDCLCECHMGPKP